MRRLIILLSLVICTEIVIYCALDFYRGARIDEYFKNKEMVFDNYINASVSSYEQIFNTIFKDKLDTTEVKVLLSGAVKDPAHRDRYRKWLRIYTQPVFDSLKSVGLMHMQFHLPDTTSFLRMHRPDFYGDKLEGIRTTMVKVSTQHVRVQGFENGRHLLAYRYIYPLEYEGVYVGSVEMSVGLSQFISNMNRLYDSGYSYILEKGKIFTNYSGEAMNKFKNLSISDNYIMEISNCCSPYTCIDDGKLRNALIQSVTADNADKVKRYEDFVEIRNIDGDTLFTYHAIKDVNGTGMGYIISHNFVTDYGNITTTYNMLFVFISGIALAVMVIFFALDYSRVKARQLNTQLEIKVEEKVRELDEKEQFFAQQSKMVTMGEMLTSILHQWKQPVSSIKLIADLLLFDCGPSDTDKELYENLSNIKEQAEFMAQTGDDFRNFMKPSKEKTVFNIAEAVNDVIRLFEFSFTRYNTGFETEWNVEDGKAANVFGYPNEFKHVLLNFFNNSRDAIIQLRETLVEQGEDVSDFKGLISIYIWVEHGQVTVKVADTGGGIPDNIIGHIFEKHFSTKDEKGSGIGLYICKEMVERGMNGQISVRNVMGGAEFTLVFPAAESMAETDEIV